MTHNGKNVNIRHVRFPEQFQGLIYGFLKEDPQQYSIFIDQSRHPLQQRKALGHELAHLFLNHLEQAPTIITTAGGSIETKERNQDIEKEANRQAWKYYRMYKAGQLSD